MIQRPRRINGLASKKVHSERNGQEVVSDCRMATGFFSRLCGWMMVPPVSAGEGLLLSPCNDIHMGFMRFAIDAVFLRSLDPDRSDLSRFEVTSVRPGLQPWRLLPVRDGQADSTLELPAGAAQSAGIIVGDVLICSG